MRRFIQIGLLSFVLCPLSFYASDIVCVGTATQVVNKNDTLFIFKDEIHLKSALGAVDWYSAETNTIVFANTDEIYPDEGGYYIEQGDYISEPVYAFLYTEPVIDTLLLTAGCESSTLTIPSTGNAKPFAYTRPDGTKGSYARACTINYNELSFHTDTWVDSAVTMTEHLKIGNYFLPALYGATPVSLCYDADIRQALGLEAACVETELPEEEVVAVNMQLTSLATVRGEEGEKSNEKNRPTSQKLISGSEYSGPLEVAFYSNPTPAVQFYVWSIYKATDRIAIRKDRDIRYTFSEPGSYKVTCQVTNESCESDSMEVTVAISESYLAVPNVFTPNGDGKNDEFKVAYRSLKEFHCWVYNRWGKLIYEWTDPAKGWDGTIGGNPAAEGAYYYVIRALGTDAAKNAHYTMKPIYDNKKKKADTSILGVYQLSGDINLLRGKK